MENQLIVAPKNNPGVASEINDDTVLCKYITYFLKKETDDKDNIFPGKPIIINKVNAKNSILYSYKNKYYTKDGIKLNVVRDLTINSSIINKNGVYQLDIKYVDSIDKKNTGSVNSIIIKKQNIVDILSKNFEQKKSI